MRLQFTKMHGLGNDFMVIDLVSQHALFHHVSDDLGGVFQLAVESFGDIAEGVEAKGDLLGFGAQGTALLPGWFPAIWLKSQLLSTETTLRTFPGYQRVTEVVVRLRTHTSPG